MIPRPSALDADATSQIGDLPAPAPPSGHGLSESRHPRCLADANYDFANRSDFLDGSTVIQSPFEMPLELRVDLVYVGQHMLSRKTFGYWASVDFEHLHLAV